MNRGSALPRWVRAADYVSLAFVVIALTIAASGGFRVRVGTWRFALTSPYRLIFWAIAIVAVRHLIARDAPIYRHLSSQIAEWTRAAAFRAAVSTSITTRSTMFFVGYMSIFLIGWAPGAPPYRDFDSELMNLPLRWDGGWYLQIAIHGYSYVHSAGAAGQQNIVFFPAFPVIVRVVSLLLGGSRAAFYVSATLISLGAFLCALVYVYLLAREDLDDDGARTSLWLLAAYPFACFFGAIYTESLFLLGAAGAFYHFRRAEWWRAGMWAVLVGLTRPNGFLLAVPLGILAVSPWIRALTVRRRSTTTEAPATAVPSTWAWQTPHPKTALAVASLPILGMLIYSLFVWNIAGDPFAWLAGHAAWGRHYSGLTTVVSDRYYYIANAGLYAYVSQLPIDVLNAIGATFVIVAAVPVARRLGLAYAVFILINILPPIAQGGLMSAGRFSAVLFPAFIWLAAAIPPSHRGGWIAAFAAMQALNSVLFFTWRAMF